MTWTGTNTSSVAFIAGDLWFEVTKYEGCDLGS